MSYLFSNVFMFFFTCVNTLIFNFYYFSFFEAIKLPVLVSGNVVFKKLSGTVLIEKPTLFGVKLGFGDVGIFDSNNSKSLFELRGVLNFLGKANIGHGSKLSVSGTLVLGDNFQISAESAIVATNTVTVGKNVLISWDVLIMDTDFHRIISSTDFNKDIYIGDNVWIGARCLILKGVSLSNGTVVAAMSRVTSSITEENVMISGNPSKLVKKNVEWEF
jgi:acetyltransferase-like isoleucine patch superfamily enzyme